MSVKDSTVSVEFKHHAVHARFEKGIFCERDNERVFEDCPRRDSPSGIHKEKTLLNSLHTLVRHVVYPSFKGAPRTLGLFSSR